MDGSGVEVTNNQAGGDSGCVAFDLSGDSAWIISLATYGTAGPVATQCSNPEYARGGGWPAYMLYNNAGVRFE